MLYWVALIFPTPRSSPTSPSPSEPDCEAAASQQLAVGWWAFQFTPRVALLDEAVLLEDAPFEGDVLELPAAAEGEEIVFDYASLGLNLRRHPLALLRPQLRERRLLTAKEMRGFPNGRLARACGIVTMRQQPNTSNGVIPGASDGLGGVCEALKRRFAPG